MQFYQKIKKDYCHVDFFFQIFQLKCGIRETIILSAYKKSFKFGSNSNFSNMSSGGVEEFPLHQLSSIYYTRALLLGNFSHFVAKDPHFIRNVLLLFHSKCFVAMATKYRMYNNVISQKVYWFGYAKYITRYSCPNCREIYLMKIECLG